LLDSCRKVDHFLKKEIILYIQTWSCLGIYAAERITQKLFVPSIFVDWQLFGIVFFETHAPVNTKHVFSNKFTPTICSLLFLGTYRAITVSVILEKFYFSSVVISRLVLAKTWHYICKVLKKNNNVFRTEFSLTTWVLTRDSCVTL
jgi:hypothetical protein